MILLKKPIKDFEEYQRVLDRLGDLEKQGKEDIREFRHLKLFINKFEKPYILANETPVEEEKPST